MGFTKPEKNIEQLELKDRDTVAVFGSGAGGHSFAVARALKGTGRVYAIDVRKDMLSKLKNESLKQNLTNIVPVLGNIEIPRGTTLEDSSCNVVVIPNTLFAYDDKPAIMHEAYRILKEEGRLLVVDWKDSFGGMGPTPEHIVTEQKATELAVGAGFSFLKTISAGTHHYGALYRKK